MRKVNTLFCKYKTLQKEVFIETYEILKIDLVRGRIKITGGGGGGGTRRKFGNILKPYNIRRKNQQ
jgi:hypothetical protein